MALKMTNDADVVCFVCEEDIPAGSGHADEWNDERFRCESCFQTREAEKQAERFKKAREGGVLLALLPAAEKLGDVYAIRVDPSAYTQEIVVTRKGKMYKITVVEVERD